MWKIKEGARKVFKRRTTVEKRARPKDLNSQYHELFRFISLALPFKERSMEREQQLRKIRIYLKPSIRMSSCVLQSLHTKGYSCRLKKIFTLYV